jgi:type 1 glutamine amidotransferase
MKTKFGLRRWLMGVAVVYAVAFGLWSERGWAQTAPKNSAKRVLLVTGVDYPGHHWRETAPVLAKAVSADSRLSVITIESPAFLDSVALADFDCVFLHFQNWEQPGPGEQARTNLQRFVERGGGLVLAHFACGAWHGEWPEFAALAGRVWFGANPGPGKRQHDPYGKFLVEFPQKRHDVVRGMKDFETEDELYTCLTGEHPIEVLAQAKSKIDGEYYPMAFTSRYGKGRTFHCVLGHDTRALDRPEVKELFQRGCAWTVGLEPARPGPESKAN